MIKQIFVDKLYTDKDISKFEGKWIDESFIKYPIINFDANVYYNDNGIYRLLLSDYELPVNIGNPSEISILDFAKEVVKQMGVESKIIHKDLPKNDPKQRRPDISKAKDFLGWEPRIERAEGLGKTIEYFKGLTLEEINRKPKEF